MLVWSNSKPSVWHSEPFIVWAGPTISFYFPSSLAYIHCPTLTSLLSVPPCHHLHLCVFASMESHV